MYLPTNQIYYSFLVFVFLAKTINAWSMEHKVDNL